MAHLLRHQVRVDFPIYQGGGRPVKKAVLAKTSFGNLERDNSDRVNVVALDGINIEIRNGDRLAIVGSNGAGKSTLLMPSTATAPAHNTASTAMQASAGTILRRGTAAMITLPRIPFAFTTDRVYWAPRRCPCGRMRTGRLTALLLAFRESEP